MSTPVILTTSSSVYPRVLYANRFNDGTLSVSTEDTDYPKENLNNFRPWKRWKATAVPATVTVTFTSAIDVTAWAIEGHNIGSVSGSVYMETSNDGGSTWDSFGTTKSPTDDEVLYAYDDQVSCDAVRWTFTGSSSPEVGVIFVGEELVFTRGVRDGFAAESLSQLQENRMDENRDGEPLGVSVEKIMADSTYSINEVPFAWAKANWVPFKDQCQSEPFFTWWNPITDPEGASFHNAGKFQSAAHSRKGFVNLNFESRGTI